MCSCLILMVDGQEVLRVAAPGDSAKAGLGSYPTVMDSGGKYSSAYSRQLLFLILEQWEKSHLFVMPGSEAQHPVEGKIFVFLECLARTGDFLIYT